MTLTFNHAEKIKFLTDVVNEKLTEENLDFAEVSLSQWGDLIDEQTLDMWSVSRADLNDTANMEPFLDELIEGFNNDHPQDAQRIASGLKIFAGDMTTTALTVVVGIVVLAVLMGVKVRYKRKTKNSIFEFSYGQSQQTQDKLIAAVTKTIAQVNAKKQQSPDQSAKQNSEQGE
ncbi:MAG: hypothetical protein HRT35_22435 [Algicola sp.]|nr:hypothetical protein [Algicola sp.]